MRATRVAALAACLFAACGNDPAPAPAPVPPAGKAPAPATPPAPDAAPDAKPKDGGDAVPPVGAPMKVTLLEAGAPPRKALRYHPKAGTKAQFEYVATQKNKVSNAPHLTVQTTTMIADYEVSSVDAAGNAGVRISMHDMRSEMPGQPGAEQANAMLEGFRVHVAAQMSPLGAMSKTDVAIDADPSGKLTDTMKPMLDSLGQTMNQISVQLPSEPVGVGAKWTVVGSMAMLGTTVTSTSTMTITSISGDRVQFASVTTGNVKDQKMTMSGIESDIHEMKIDGSGTITSDLTNGVANEMEMTVKTIAKMTVHVPAAEPQKMDVDSTVEMKFVPKK